MVELFLVQRRYVWGGYFTQKIAIEHLIGASLLGTEFDTSPELIISEYSATATSFVTRNVTLYFEFSFHVLLFKKS